MPRLPHRPVDMVRDVDAFHQKFGVEYLGDNPRRLPGPMPAALDLEVAWRRVADLFKRVIDANPDNNLRAFRRYFLLEEAFEGAVAAARDVQRPSDDEWAAEVDADLDAIYVAIGNLRQMGVPVAEAWDRVQAANMAKERATSPAMSKRGSVHDVVKPPGWKAPRFDDLLAPGPVQLGAADWAAIDRDCPNCASEGCEFCAWTGSVRC